MKKSVFVLLLLLTVLIVTCVYDKTYTIYSNSSAKELILVEQKNVSKQENTTQTVGEWRKDLKSTALPVTTVPVKKKDAEAKTEVVKKSVVKPTQLIENTHKVESKSSIKSNSTSAQKAPIAVKKEVHESKDMKSNTVAKTQEKSEKELVDYLMWALKNRDIALKNRDEIEARIQDLITQALNDRKIVIEERSKNEIILDQLQIELIDARDTSYENITNPKTTTKGEK